MEYQLYRSQIGLSPTILSSLDNTATLNHSAYLLAWPRIDHHVSGLIILTISHTQYYELVAFARVLHLANTINSLTHYTKGTLSHLLYDYALTTYMIASSESISLVIDALFTFPSRYSSLSLNIHT